MSPADFRRMALDLPGAVEGAHMGHADFRVDGRIFATLGAPDPSFGMVSLTPEQQAAFVDAEPAVFAPVKGGWGARGATNVLLRVATAAAVRPALTSAWSNAAKKERRRAR
jgi:hypothetical protein